MSILRRKDGRGGRIGGGGGMILETSRSGFHGALKAVQTCIAKKATIPILSHVLLDGTNGQLTVKSSDLDCEVSAQIPATVCGGESIAVDAGLLSNIAGQCNGEVISIDDNEGRAKVCCGKSRFSLPCLPGHQFPYIGFSPGEEKAEYEIDAKAFCDAIAEVSYAVDPESLRVYYVGLYIHAADGKWFCVAADGARFARTPFSAPPDGETLVPFILPQKSATIIGRLFAGSGSVRLCVDSRKACFTGSGVRLTTKLVEAVFPDYSKILASENPYTVNVQKADLAKAVSRAAPFAAEAPLQFLFGLSSLQLTVASKAGQIADEIASDGEVPFQLLVEHKYMNDALCKLQDGLITLSITTRAAPVHIRDSREDVLHLIMPRVA